MYNKKLKLAHVLIQVKQSQDLQPANWTPSRPAVELLSVSEGLRTGTADNESLGQGQEKAEAPTAKQVKFPLAPAFLS